MSSAASEPRDGRNANNILEVGEPIPLINTRTALDAGGIFDPTLNNVLQIWEAIFLSAQGDTALFGLNDTGANVLADFNDDDVVDATGGTFGPEAFQAHFFDIIAVSRDSEFDLPTENDKFSLVFTTDRIGFDNPNAIMIDTSVTIDDINDVQFSTTATKAQILGQIRVNNLQEFGGSLLDEQQENFVTQVARITRSTGEVIGRDVVLGLLGAGPIPDDELLTVDMPRYNLLHMNVQQLHTTTGIEQLVAKIDAVDPACMADGETDSEIAFDETCVHASQIVDFQIKETDNRDIDGNPLTGEVYDSLPDLSPGVIGPGDPWDTLTGSDAVGFDRDLTTSRISVGAFRVLDLVDYPMVEPEDQIRVTTLLLDDDSGIIDTADIISLVAHTILVDIVGLGVVFSPAPTDQEPDNIASPIGTAFSNVAYRMDLGEDGSNSSVFSGRADFFTFNQFDTVSDILADITLTGDPVKMWVPNRLVTPNRLAFTYFDTDSVDFFREVNVTFDYETRDGMIEWDRSLFSFGQDAFLTIKDEDLNRRADSQERYHLPIDSFVFFELSEERVCSEVDPAVSGILGGDANSCAPGEIDSFFNAVNTTLLETGTNTGTFVAQITIPMAILVDATPGTPETPPVSVITEMMDLEANYMDIRDGSSMNQEFNGIINIEGIGLNCFNVMPTLIGTAGNDILVGTGEVDVIHGLGGNDTIVGLGGNDIICSGDGDDKIFGGNGNDTAGGGMGHDFISLGQGNDRAFGGSGNDRIFGGDGNDGLSGGTEDDSLFGQDGDDNLFGGIGIDRLDGGENDVGGGLVRTVRHYSAVKLIIKGDIKPIFSILRLVTTGHI